MPLKSGFFAYDPSIQKIYDVVEVASNDYNLPNFSKIKRAVKQNVSFTTKRGSTPYTYQVHHPPLYFLSSLLFFLPAQHILKGFIPVYYATRLASTLFYALSVWIAFLIGLKIVKNKKIAEYLAVAYAINPVTLKMGVAVNPDIAATCCGLLILLFFLDLSSQKIISIKSAVLLTLLLTVSVYIKFQNVVFFLFALIFFLYYGYQRRKLTYYFSMVSGVVFASLVCLAPWFYHSLTTYGNIIPSYVAYALFCTANLPAFPWYRIPFETIFEFRHAISHFAGFLGWGGPYPFKLFFIFYTLTFLSLFIVGLISLFRMRQKKWWLYLLGYCGVIWLFFLGVSFTYKINRYSCDIQGRYLLATLLPLLLIIWGGLRSIFPRKSDIDAAYGIFLFSVWQYLFILCYVLLPRYYV